MPAFLLEHAVWHPFLQLQAVVLRSSWVPGWRVGSGVRVFFVTFHPHCSGFKLLCFHICPCKYTLRKCSCAPASVGCNVARFKLFFNRPLRKHCGLTYGFAIVTDVQCYNEFFCCLNYLVRCSTSIRKNWDTFLKCQVLFKYFYKFYFPLSLKCKRAVIATDDMQKLQMLFSFFVTGSPAPWGWLHGALVHNTCIPLFR